MKKANLMVKIMGVVLGITLATSRVYGAYNSEDAVYYAYQYATSPNTSCFNYFDADCTNFVSQCIFFGGIGMKNLPKGVGVPSNVVLGIEDAWYYKDFGSYYNTTKSWTCVENFAKYWKNATIDRPAISNNYVAEQLAQTVKRGDIIQCKEQGESEYGHSVICVNVTGTEVNNVYLAYHSLNKNNVSLKEFDSAYCKGTTIYRIIRFK